jgi:arylsulfatase A
MERVGTRITGVNVGRDGVNDSGPCRIFAVRAIRWLLVAIAVLPSPQGFSVEADTRPPNIVIFLLDDLGWRDLGCYGSPFHETPHIDRLAEEGVRFTDAYAACHVCSPTRASLLTGKYPARLHLTDWLPGRKQFPFQPLLNASIEQALPAAELTIAEALREHGYATAHIGKWHLGEEPLGPLAQGFDLQVPLWNKGWPPKGYHAPFDLDGLADQPGQYLTDRLTDEAERFITDQRDRPFFLYLSHFAVHDPIEGRADLVAKYRAKRNQTLPAAGPDFVLEGNPDDPRPLIAAELAARSRRPEWAGYRVLPDRTVKIKQHQDNVEFAAMVEAADQSLGRIQATLRELNLQDQTIIVFVSDNGGMSAANFGNPDRVVAPGRLDRSFSTSNLPLRGAKGWLYEGGIRVPLIIRWPAQGRAGAVCSEPVITTDVYPTVLEMAGLPARAEQHVDGVSLVPILQSDTTLRREALYWHFPHYSNHGMQSPGGALRRGRHKLIEYFENGTVQLFDLLQDPGEQHNLAPTEPDRAAHMRAQLEQWRTLVGAASMSPNPDYRPPEETP